MRSYAVIESFELTQLACNVSLNHFGGLDILFKTIHLRVGVSYSHGISEGALDNVIR